MNKRFDLPRARTGALLVAAALALPALAQTAAPAASSAAYPQPTPAMQAIIDKDTSRHFGDAPLDAGPYATDLSGDLTPAAIDKALRRVADWQLARSQPYFSQIWTESVMYVGFMAASSATGDPKYRDAMLQMARHFEFGERSHLPNADDLSIAQTYLALYVQERQAAMLAPTRAEMDALLPLDTLKPGDPRIPWWWCDALFMAPSVWTQMYKVTGEHKYLDYVHLNWKRTSSLLYDQDEHLYARDASYKDKREPNGKKVFWSRGEGWVMGGIARILVDVPLDDPQRGFYVQQLREMAERIAGLQGPDGLWHAGLLDPADYPLPEISGSALFVYAMAYGVNQGILDGARYRPVIAKAWAGIVKNIYADGRLGNIQQTGAEPAFYRPSSSFDYGVGGFMLAAAELKKMSGGAKESAKGGAK